MKKILLVDNSSWNIYNFRLPLVKKLALQGYKVVVVSPLDEYIRYLNETYFIRHIPVRRLRPRSTNPFNALLLVWELFRHYRQERPDLVIHFTIKPNIFGSLAARLAGLQSISVVTGLGYTFLHPVGLNKIAPFLYKLAFRKIKKLLLYNHDDMAFFTTNKILPPEKCMIIPGSGVNTNRFRPLPSGRDDSRFIFLFIGRLLYDKGIAEFVSAAKQVTHIARQSECWVVGDLTDGNPSAIPKEKLLDWIENKDIRYLGSVRDVRKVIKQADVLVLPSHREGLPRVVLEAMSMGKPIITTDAAGCRETVVDGKNGLLVPVGDAQSLAQAMLAVYQLSPDVLAKMGELSRQRALEFFDEKIITATYMDLLKELFSADRHEPTRAGSPAVF